MKRKFVTKSSIINDFEVKREKEEDDVVALVKSTATEQVTAVPEVKKSTKGREGFVKWLKEKRK